MKNFTKLANLKKAEDNYYLTANYLLTLANQAYDLFLSSEVHEKRLLLKITLQNLELEGKKVRYHFLNPFDKIANLASRQLWLRTLNEIRTFSKENQQPDF
ncbi:MAG: hypothetical protein KatS3mg101_1186 [Patescibacteria group bacterium]|nr:MAG: hypothetical protein KatS3mg101_1186 [Patescibacteria group bacterium]